MKTTVVKISSKNKKIDKLEKINNIKNIINFELLWTINWIENKDNLETIINEIKEKSNWKILTLKIWNKLNFILNKDNNNIFNGSPYYWEYLFNINIKNKKEYLEIINEIKSNFKSIDKNLNLNKKENILWLLNKKEILLINKNDLFTKQKEILENKKFNNLSFNNESWEKIIISKNDDLFDYKKINLNKKTNINNVSFNEILNFLKIDFLKFRLDWLLDNNIISKYYIDKDIIKISGKEEISTNIKDINIENDFDIKNYISKK